MVRGLQEGDLSVETGVFPGSPLAKGITWVVTLRRCPHSTRYSSCSRSAFARVAIRYAVPLASVLFSARAIRSTPPSAGIRTIRVVEQS